LSAIDHLISSQNFKNLSKKLFLHQIPPNFPNLPKISSSLIKTTRISRTNSIISTQNPPPHSNGLLVASLGNPATTLSCHVHHVPTHKNEQKIDKEDKYIQIEAAQMRSRSMQRHFFIWLRRKRISRVFIFSFVALLCFGWEIKGDGAM
jgi:hypothetical protein